MFEYAKPKQKQVSKNTVQKKEEPKTQMSAPNFTGIPETMKTRFETMSGFSFDDVRVHYNSGKPAQLQALAYTQGNQVFVGPGQEKHLGHELGHVVQQKSGRVKPTGMVGGVPVNDDVRLEREADHVSGTPFQFMKVSKSGDAVVAQMEKGLMEGTYVCVDNEIDDKFYGRIKRFDKDSNNYIVDTDLGDVWIDESFVKEVSKEIFIKEKEKAGMSASLEDIDAINYSEAAQEFEEQLGIFLSEYLPAQQAVQQLLHSIIDKIPLDENYGTQHTTVAGMVGSKIDTLEEVIKSGNLREQLTMIYNIFMYSRSKETDKEKKKKKDEIFGKLVDPKENKRMKYSREDRTPTVSTTLEKDENGRRKVIKGDDYTYGFDHIHIKDPIPSPPLSERETTALGTRDGHKKWEQGGYIWDYNMETSFQKEGHALSVPIVAGPSGTSNAIMNMAKTHGVDMYNIRLALLGYLIPARQHSFHEIMLACSEFGLKYFADTDLRYQYIDPLKIEELREHVVKKTKCKKFPHEVGKSLKSSGVASYDYQRKEKPKRPEPIKQTVPDK